MRNVAPADRNAPDAARSPARRARPRIVLASASPRRLALLRDAGFDVIVLPAALDDDRLPIIATSPEIVAASRAWLKASAVAARPESLPADALVVAADTLCAIDDRVIGKPASKVEARAMLDDLQGRTHRTITAVALADRSGARSIWWDVSRVTIGELAAELRRAHVDGERWRGKSGGYNLAEVIDAGWPIECDGDPTSVMGLPMRRLRAVLERWPDDGRDAERAS